METSLALPTKEVEQTNKQMMKLQTEANNLAIETPKDVETAAGLLETIKNAEKTVTGRKEEITRPLMRSLASVRDLFKPIEITLDNAKKVIKAKMLAYQTAEDDRIEKEKARVLARQEKGTIKTETAVKKLEEIGESKTAMRTRTLTKVKVVDETLVPREWLVVDMPRVTEAVLKHGLTIPGVELYKEKIIAS